MKLEYEINTIQLTLLLFFSLTLQSLMVAKKIDRCYVLSSHPTWHSRSVLVNENFAFSSISFQWNCENILTFRIKTYMAMQIVGRRSIELQTFRSQWFNHFSFCPLLLPSCLSVVDQSSERENKRARLLVLLFLWFRPTRKAAEIAKQSVKETFRYDGRELEDD